jgi:putative addiction module component (TIGR02574 family)
MQDVADILELPIEERLHLIEAIWDSLAEVPDVVPVSR